MYFVGLHYQLVNDHFSIKNYRFVSEWMFGAQVSSGV